MNFCRFPPDRELAITFVPRHRTSKSEIHFFVNDLLMSLQDQYEYKQNYEFMKENIGEFMKLRKILF